MDGGAASMDHTGAGTSAMCPLTRVYVEPCNPLVPSGPVVTTTCSSADAPSPQGGTVADGLYFLESATWYRGCQQAAMARSVWLVCGELWDNAAIIPDGGVAHTNYLSAIQGTTNTLNPLCSSPEPEAGMAYGYSASASRLTLMTNYGTSVLVTTYALQ
jgi:hypothetical protein